jgi:Uma2 family endonuclease
MVTPRTANRTYPTARAASGPKSVLERIRAYQDNPVLQRIRPEGMPWACEDEESQMGESTVHTLSAGILFFSLTFHFARRVSFRVFANLNLHFSPDHPNLFLTPDVMVVKTPQPLPAQLASYRIGEQGPTPLLVGEVLSPRTYHEGDLDRKPIQYGEIGIDEYLIADVTGELLSQRLLLLQRQRDGRWRDAQDTDGGVTSRLGFRVVIGDDGQLRVLDSKTRQPYARPDEAQTAAEELAVEVEVRRRAEERVRALEEELARLRGRTATAELHAKKGRRRKP